jgi:hypothetical protein
MDHRIIEKDRDVNGDQQSLWPDRKSQEYRSNFRKLFAKKVKKISRSCQDSTNFFGAIRAESIRYLPHFLGAR